MGDPKVVRDIDALKPHAAELCRLVLQVWDAAGFDVVVTETLRSRERQEFLYAKGRTTPGPIVTRAPPGTSRHETGLAFDVAFGDGTGLTWTGPWARIGAIGEALGLEWGGSWHSFQDKPHFQAPPLEKEAA